MTTFIALLTPLLPRYVVDLQCTTNNGNPNDCSPLPLFERVDPAVLEIPVYKKLAALYDNYYPVSGRLSGCLTVWLSDCLAV